MIDLARFRAGDEQYFEQLIHEHGPLVLMVAHSFSLDLDHAEDLFQEIWKHVYQHRASFAGRGSFRAWLHRLSINVCRTDHRSRRVHANAVDKLKARGVEESWGWRPVDPLAHTERGEFRRALHRAMAELSEREHEAIVLRVLEDRSSREVSEIMGIQQATVRSLIRHAIKRLRTIMEDPDDEQMPRHQSTS